MIGDQNKWSTFCSRAFITCSAVLADVKCIALTVFFGKYIISTFPSLFFVVTGLVSSSSTLYNFQKFCISIGI